uniref:NADH dehydrogenase subunit 2 n=1 Tax=Heterostelium pallidum TaxID=13642 RepID=Q5ILJ3_HETPA|nr:NADH dehydrogenase subunit 2 [Heterostelium pallidum]AAU00617.1 NADH dehydrogenase subunit 2 [Heterostelium pallidum]
MTLNLIIRYSIYLIPLMVLLISAVSVLNKNQRMNIILMSIYCYLGLIFINLINNNETALFLNNHLQMNDLIKFFELILIIFVFIVMVIIHISIEYGLRYKVSEEMLILMMCSIIGMLISIEALNLITLFLSFEITSLSFYILALNKNRSKKSIEGSLKYYIVGGLTSTIFLLGVACLYYITGSVSYTDINLIFQNFDITQLNYLQNIGILGISLIVISLCIKIGLAPFHGWVIDTYEGTGLLMTLFFTLTQKIVIIAVLINFYMYICTAINLGLFLKIIYIFIILTMIVGILGCLGQQRMIRFIAYSGIINSGFLIIFFLGNTKEELITYSIYYLINYIIGLITLISLVIGNPSFVKETNIEIFPEIKRIWQNNKLFAVIFIITLLFLAGLPPFIGFVSKLLLILSNFTFNQIFLVTLILVYTVGIMVYYINIIKIIRVDGESVKNENMIIDSTVLHSIIIGGFCWQIYSQVYIDEIISYIGYIIGNIYY